MFKQTKAKISNNSLLNKVNLSIFAVLFAGIGGYFIISSFAASPLVGLNTSAANIFISSSGSDSTCIRFATAQSSTPGNSQMCKTAKQAYSIAERGDTVWVLSGDYTNGSLGFYSGGAPVSISVSNDTDCNASKECIYFLPKPGQESSVISGEIEFKAGQAPQHLYYKNFVRGACPSFSPVDFHNSTAGTNDITADSFKAMPSDTQCKPYLAGPHKYVRILNGEYTWNCNDGGQASGMQIQSTQEGMFGEADNHAYVPDHILLDNNFFHDYVVNNCSGGHQDCIHIYAWTNSIIRNSTFDRCYDSSILAEGLDENNYPENNIIENNWFGPTILGVNNCCMRGDSNPSAETFDNWTIRFNTSTSTFMNKTGNVLNNVSFIGNVALGDISCRSGTNLIWKYNIYASPGSKCDPTDTAGTNNNAVKLVNLNNGSLDLRLQSGSIADGYVPSSLANGCSSVYGGKDKFGNIRATSGNCDAGAYEYNSGGGTTCTSTKTADINCDNIVSVIDLSLLLNNYSKTTSQLTNPRADIITTGSSAGKVDISDLSALLSQYGQSGGGGTVGCASTTTNVPDGPDPWGGCWPGPSNTGVPANKVATLTPYTTPCTITTDGTTIDNKDIQCSELLIRANNVTISNSRIKNSVHGVEAFGNAFTISDSELDGAMPKFGGVACVNCGVDGYDFKIIRSEIIHTNRGAFCQNTCTVQDSWIHGVNLDTSLCPQASSGTCPHASAVRNQQNTTLKHNSLGCDFTGPFNADLGCSADLSGYADFTPIKDDLIDSNLFLANNVGLDYCVYAGGTSGHLYSNDPTNATNVRFINNIFQGGPNGKCGKAYAVTGLLFGRGNEWTNNKFDNGTLIDCTSTLARQQFCE